MAEYDWPCIHRGESVGTFDCGCGQGPQPTYACQHPLVSKGECVVRMGSAKWKAAAKQYAVCGECSYRASPTPAEAIPPRPVRPLDHLRDWKQTAQPPPITIAVMPRRLIRLDDRALGFQHCFNGSIIQWQGERLIAVRSEWEHSQITICRVTPDWRLEKLKTLELPATKWNSWGAEDPRLFVHRGELHVSYTAVWQVGRSLLGRVALATLDAEYRVVTQVIPEVTDRRETEKNWAWFSWRDELRCVYWSQPLTILRLAGDRMEPVATHDWQPGFTAGEIRGGAPPVLHNGEYYHFFHGLTQTGHQRYYSIGLYTFDVEPPFLPKRVIRQPLLLPNDRERPAPHHACAVFPCGAFHDDARGEWVISYGYFDHWLFAGTWSGSEIERALEPVR